MNVFGKSYNNYKKDSALEDIPLKIKEFNKEQVEKTEEMKKKVEKFQKNLKEEKDRFMNGGKIQKTVFNSLVKYIKENYSNFEQLYVGYKIVSPNLAGLNGYKSLIELKKITLGKDKTTQQNYLKIKDVFFDKLKREFKSSLQGKIKNDADRDGINKIVDLILDTCKKTFIDNHKERERKKQEKRLFYADQGIYGGKKTKRKRKKQKKKTKSKK